MRSSSSTTSRASISNAKTTENPAKLHTNKRQVSSLYAINSELINYLVKSEPKVAVIAAAKKVVVP